jgi:hypothetical protein
MIFTKIFIMSYYLDTSKFNMGLRGGVVYNNSRNILVCYRSYILVTARIV